MARPPGYNECMPTLLWMAFLSGCGEGEPTPPPVPVNPADYGDPIGTTPNFYGFVPKNLLWISVDTFRRDSLKAYGGTGLTDFLDGLHDSGYALTEHQTLSNWTFAGTTGNLLGRTHEENGFEPRLSNEFREPMPEGTPMLPDWLRPSGFYSIVVSSNSWYSPEWRSTQGFDEEWLPTNAAALNISAEGITSLESARNAGLVDRWFLHLHIKEPHAPYNPPVEFLSGLEELADVPWDLANKDEQYQAIAEWGSMTEAEQDLLLKHLRVRYDGELQWTDNLLEAMWIDVAAAGLLEDTLVVVWNDHGEGFFEHGYQGHAYQLGPEENDGLMLFWAKNIVQGTWNEPTSAIDLAPTLLKLYGIDVPAEVTGIPVSEAAYDRPIFSSTVTRLLPRQAVRMGDYRMEYSWSGAVDMYDRAADPTETTDLYDPADPIAQALWAALEPQVVLSAPLVTDLAQNLPAL